MTLRNARPPYASLSLSLCIPLSLFLCLALFLSGCVCSSGSLRSCPSLFLIFPSPQTVCAERVVYPPTSCCGMAGERGLRLPELPDAALAWSFTELNAMPAGEKPVRGVSTSRTCEVRCKLCLGYSAGCVWLVYFCRSVLVFFLSSLVLLVFGCGELECVILTCILRCVSQINVANHASMPFMSIAYVLNEVSVARTAA